MKIYIIKYPPYKKKSIAYALTTYIEKQDTLGSISLEEFSYSGRSLLVLKFRNDENI